MQPLIREAVPQDLAAVGDLMISGAAFHAAALPAVFRAPENRELMQTFVRLLLSDAQSRLLVAEQDGVIVGLAHLAFRESAPLDILVPRRYLLVENLLVREDYRRQGVGSALLHAAEEYARAAGVSEVQLNVWEFNTAARALYERQGYTTSSRKMSKPVE